MSKRRKQGGAFGNGNGKSGAQWGASVTLAAIQSESVPLRPSPFQQQYGLQQAYTSTTSASLPPTRAPSARGGSQSHFTPPAPIVSRAQSALGVYRPATVDISPKTTSFAKSGHHRQAEDGLSSSPTRLRGTDVPVDYSLSPISPRPSFQLQHPNLVQPWPSKPPAERRKEEQTTHVNANANAQKTNRQTTVYTQTQHLPALPPSPSRSQAHAKSPYTQYQPLHLRDPKDKQESVESLAKYHRNPSVIDIVPNIPTPMRKSSSFLKDYGLQLESSPDVSLDAGKGGWDADSDSEQEKSKQQRQKASQRKMSIGASSVGSTGTKRVLISEKPHTSSMNSPPKSPAGGIRSSNLFKRAFSSSASKKKSSTSRRLSDKSSPSSPTRSILRNRQPSIVFTQSPRTSPSSTISQVSPVTPGSFTCADAVHPAKTSTPPTAVKALHARYTSSAIVSPNSVSSSNLTSLLLPSAVPLSAFPPPRPAPPPRRRRESADSDGSRKQNTSHNNSINNLHSSSSSTGFSQRSSIDGASSCGRQEDAFTDDTSSSVGSARLMTAKKLTINSNGNAAIHRLSKADSVGSVWDQESWDGESRRESDATANPPQPSSPLSPYMRKPSLAAAQRSPLVKDKLLEVDEPDTSLDEEVDAGANGNEKVRLRKLSIDADDENSSSDDEDDEEEFQDILNVVLIDQKIDPTRYRIVRTSVDDSGDVECLDSIHLVYAEEDDDSEVDNEEVFEDSISETRPGMFAPSKEALRSSPSLALDDILVSIQQIGRWDSMFTSLVWCTAYFGFWYYSALLPAAFTVMLFCIFWQSFGRNSSVWSPQAPLVVRVAALALFATITSFFLVQFSGFLFGFGFFIFSPLAEKMRTPDTHTSPTARSALRTVESNETRRRSVWQRVRG